MKTILKALKAHKTSYGLGILAGLIVLTAFFASQASFYAVKARNLEMDRKRMDLSLVQVEASMKQISAYRDRIDALTSTTVEKGVGDARPMERKLKKVRVALEEYKTFNSAAEREINAVERMDDVLVNTQRMEQTLRAVSTILSLRKDLLDGIPSITPASGWISSNFGERQSPFTGEKVAHKGIDIGAEEGVPIYATADGVVEKVALSDSYGRVLTIKHPFDVNTRFAHTSKIFVKEGQKIRRGDLVAAVGTTGRSTGPHLHYEVWVGEKPVDPMDYLLDREFLDVNIAPPSIANAIGGEDLPYDGSQLSAHAQHASVSTQPASDAEWLSDNAKRIIAWFVLFSAASVIVLMFVIKGIQPRRLASSNF